jgi:hypothetical protein
MTSPNSTAVRFNALNNFSASAPLRNSFFITMWAAQRFRLIGRPFDHKHITKDLYKNFQGNSQLFEFSAHVVGELSGGMAVFIIKGTAVSAPGEDLT